MKLGFDIEFNQLYSRDGLVAIDSNFVEYLGKSDADLAAKLQELRLAGEKLPEKEYSNFITTLAPHVEDFLAELFNIRSQVNELKAKHSAISPLYTCKRLFVQRKAAKSISAEQAQALDGEQIASELTKFITGEDFELAFAKAVTSWLDQPEENAANLELATKYAAWAVHSEQGKAKHKAGILFKIPVKTDHNNLVEYQTIQSGGIAAIKAFEGHIHPRDGFKLTDKGVTLKTALDEANYCIWCHNQGKDSCSKGMRDPKSNEFKTNPLAITLNGCPLEEKISEMNMLKSEGVPLGALATIIIDNPMCAGTGHRICNDCMKGCIYQKQEPVNIPQVETRTLMDILELPYGFEIYSLLTRWNPLNLQRPLAKADSGYKVLVAGLGPSGYTLAHHLLNDGHTVVGIDGLKIEPLPEEISGVNQNGGRVAFKPIRDVNELFEALDERVLAGFGGVAEYGITVRWNKNFLKIIRLLLERRDNFSLIGGVRFGSTITIDSAWQLGFDHIALCMGAGKPTILDIPNGLARGVRTASDFLMSLQLSGAAKKDSIANLQLRLPIVVIGGGLTAIDTTTESLAYYPIQVEKFLTRYEILVAAQGEENVRANWSEEDTEIAEEFITHAKAIREERKKPQPDVNRLLESWGGAKMVYRKRLLDAPSYRLNHEEVAKALEEGIHIVENLEPTAIEVDRFGYAAGVRFKNDSYIPAKTILVAAGTSPNTVLQREEPNKVKLHGKYFQAIDADGNQVTPEQNCKPTIANMLMNIEPDGKAISFFGDMHPSFAGNVVKAMGSAKQGYPVISRILANRESKLQVASCKFLENINHELRATIHDVVRLTSNIIEIVVKAPQAAKQFQPGQFYRLQNFEANAARKKDTLLAMEGLALTGAWGDKEQGLLSTIVLEMGGSSNLCADLKKGETIVLMGPTGTPTEIPRGQDVMLVGGGLGNAVLFSIGKQAREQGNRVLYFAGYKKAGDRYKIEEIEKAADVIVWCCDEASDFKPNRPQDKIFEGNILQGMLAYASGALGETPIKTETVEHIVVIGSDRMMAAVAAARHKELKPYLKQNHVAIGSINSPMQCMMKEICGQCLQKHENPITGEIKYVYSCFNQDQELDQVSFSFLNERLKQNSLPEKLTAKWLKYCLES